MHPLQMSARSKKENIKELLALGIQRGGSFFLSFNCTDQGGQIRPGFPCTAQYSIYAPPKKSLLHDEGRRGKMGRAPFCTFIERKSDISSLEEMKKSLSMLCALFFLWLFAKQTCMRERARLYCAFFERSEMCIRGYFSPFSSKARDRYTIALAFIDICQANIAL